MPFVEYILLALLGSTTAAAGSAPNNASLRTFAADEVTQPAGGEMTAGLNARSRSIPGHAASSNTNSSKGTGSKAHKGGKKGHKGGKKGKKGSGGSTTPPPK
jgi:hypothetical protein